jgi:hypothetical protein
MGFRATQDLKSRIVREDIWDDQILLRHYSKLKRQMGPPASQPV